MIVQINFEMALDTLTRTLAKRNLANSAATAHRALWLEACSYPGLKLLVEALADKQSSRELKRGPLGLDLQNVSCVFLADDIQRNVVEHGRVFLRNVRHGLYLLPDSAENGYGIGCPVDPGFAIGGERSKNPYAEKLNLARHEGLMLDDGLWSNLTS